MIVSQNIKNYFTVDVEDWFNSTILKIPLESWDTYQIRIENPVKQILSLLKHYNSKATFFILGYIANRVPDLIKQIADEGHEIASHGYYHQKITDLSPNEFRIDIEKSLETLSKLVQTEIIGYRAPSFTIIEKTFWALDILKEYGFKYDSSMYPVKFHPDYGVVNIESRPFLHKNGLFEFPLSSIKIFNNFVPFSGGAYFRFYPYPFTKLLINKLIKEDSTYNFYFHPWELDSSQPRTGANFLTNLRHSFNISKSSSKLYNLFRDFSFTNIGSSLENIN